MSPVSAAVLAEILDGGQSFRWYRTGETWFGTWSDCIARVRITPHGVAEWSAPAAIQHRVGRQISSYFAANVDFAAALDALPWRSDAHLARCAEAFPRLRLLKQPFGETLLGFLCSATKQIVQIKQMVALMAERHGAPLAERALLPAGVPEGGRFRVPTWAELAAVPEPELRKCLLGFRARYISDAARFLAAHPGWLDETEALPYAKAKERLCTLPGVGEKVADCVLLYGGGKLEAFPVDVWILKTMARRYGLEGWKPSQVAQFGRAHFGRHAGFAQQLLFGWERRFGKAEG
jgi:N-glycosylase/DNA lyase